MTDDIRALIEASLKKKVLEAFSESPELIDRMMAVAIIDYKVDQHTGSPPTYGGGIPFIDYVIGEQIRVATRQATREVIADQIDDLKEQIRQRITGGEFADAAVTAMLEQLSSDWRVQVDFRKVDD